MANLTIKDIARISGCSVSTISRVINDRPDVRPGDQGARAAK